MNSEYQVTEREGEELSTATDPVIEAKRVVTHLALGLLKQYRAIEQQTARPVTMPDEQLQWGWDKLALICLKQDAIGPRHWADLVAWLHTSVESWPGIGPLLTEANLQGPLLYSGMPSELCLELARGMDFANDPARELQDTPFKEILAHCREQHLPEQYTRARRFLVEHPYLPHGRVMISASVEMNETVREWLKECYEPLPHLCRQRIDEEEHVARCPRCGWPLEWRTNGRRLAACYSELCAQVVGNLHDTNTWEPVFPEAVRTTRGIQSSIVGPEAALWNLYQRLTAEYGLECELWPGVDAYDLSILFPSGKLWVVDLKDAASSTRLATEVGPFREVLPWDRAFFIFPEHRRERGYLAAFRRLWARPLNTEAVFLSDFVRKFVERELN